MTKHDGGIRDHSDKEPPKSDEEIGNAAKLATRDDNCEEDDWSLIVKDNILASHSETNIYFGENKFLLLDCVLQSHLSPLDICNSLSNEDYDATGHHIWLASFFLIDIMTRPLLKSVDYFGIQRNDGCLGGKKS